MGCFGAFGVGKTTFAFQTIINSLTRNKNSLFFYTKPQLPIGKIRNIVESYFDRMDKNAMRNLKIFKINDFTQLHTISFHLEFILLNAIQSENKPIHLIVIDSLTDLYKINLNPNKKEKNVELNYKLHQILANLQYLTHKYDLELLLINERSKETVNGKVVENQSGGAVMNYWISYFINIKRTPILNRRKFILCNSNHDTLLEFHLEMTLHGFKEK
ncbi:MAG: DNA repair and recombination protein RadB [Promethearchaeota archaeon]|nr:MAG: DNA repair and recombination protein RadB [Candidatus Lokiarchaeota archaeon]